VTRDLTFAQANRLDGLAREDSGARVVGWLDGPVVRRSNGKLVRVVGSGRLNAVRPERLA